MHDKKSPPRFGCVLMSGLFLSTGLLFLAGAQGPLFYSRTQARLAWPQVSSLSSQLSFPFGSSVGKRTPYEAAQRTSRQSGVYMMPESVATFSRFYLAHHPQAVEHLKTHVPRLYALKLPSDIKFIKATSEKKEMFIKIILPLILKTNERILAQRARLLAIDYRVRHGLPLQKTDQVFLRKVALEYKVPTLSLPLLLQRVDIVPASLAIAQSVIETGFGTSRVAIKQNAMFGHMRTKKEVEAFPSILESVYVYVRNLNRNPAYKTFQLLRHELRSKGKPLCGHHLANGLVKYSELGKDYIKKVQHLIKLYNLDQYDTVQFLSA